MNQPDQPDQPDQPPLTATGATSSLLGDFELRQLQSRDELGEIHQARQVSRERAVLVRVLAADLARQSQLIGQFRQTIADLGKLQHPVLVRPLAAQRSGPTQFAVFEAAAGQDLQSWVSTRGPLALPVTLKIAVACADLLQAAHAAGLWHGDLRPAQLIITAAGKPKLAGWGYSAFRLAGRSIVQADPCAAPELARQPAVGDSRSDIFSLGCTLFFCLTGESPFPATANEAFAPDETGEAGVQSAARPASLRRLNPSVTAAWETLIEQMLSWRPEQRPSAADVLQTLRKLASAPGAPIDPTAPATPADTKSAAVAVPPETAPQASAPAAAAVAGGTPAVPAADGPVGGPHLRTRWQVQLGVGRRAADLGVLEGAEILARIATGAIDATAELRNIRKGDFFPIQDVSEFAEALCARQAFEAATAPPPADPPARNRNREISEAPGSRNREISEPAEQPSRTGSKPPATSGWKRLLRRKSSPPQTAAPAARKAGAKSRGGAPLPSGRRRRAVWKWAFAALLIFGVAGFDAVVLFDPALPPPAAERGFHSKVFTDAEGKEHKYVVFIPHQYDLFRKPPVLMFLNGIGENGNDGLRQISVWFGSDVWNLKRNFPFVVVAPQCSAGGRHWHAGGENARRAMQILAEVEQAYHTDPDRVYLTGLSSGGAGVWDIAALEPTRFAAIAPICAGGFHAFTNHEAAQALADANVQVWSFHNQFDNNYVRETQDEFQRELLAAGTSPRFTIYPTGGHDAWRRAYRTPVFYDWLLQQSLDRNARSRPRFQPLFDGTDLSHWDAPSGKAWEINQERELVGRRLPTDSSDVPLVSLGSYRGFELHLEAQLVKGTELRIGIGSAPAPGSSDGATLVFALPEQGSGGVFAGGTGGCLAPFDPAAERAFLSKGWNDIRIRVQDQQLSLNLNGWPLAAAKIPRLAEFNRQLSLQVASQGDSEVRWRHIRLQELK